MKRNEFIKNIGISTLGLSTLAFKDLIQRQSIKIYDNYLRGTFDYELKKIFNKLTVGQELILQREASNEYDKYAIAVYFNQHKLGYIAAYENIVLANMIDNKVDLKTSISCLSKSSNENRQIAIQIFCNLIAPTPFTYC